MRYIIVVLILFGTVDTARADITAADQYFTALCVSDQSVGFNWRNNDWKFTHFKPKKYIVQKFEMKPLITIPNSGFCLQTYETEAREPIRSDTSALVSGCYNYRDMGGKFHPTASKLCYEDWRKDKTDWYLDSVECPLFKFSPNGHFHLVSLHSNLKPKADYKDSMAVTVGKCSIIEE